MAPLQYNCQNDSPTCGPAQPGQSVNSTPGVGETYGAYNGSYVKLLYTENYYCGTPADGYTAQSTSGCEAGHASSTPPPDNTTPDTATGGDVLYIPVPLFSNPPATQCTSKATCIDHPQNIDLSPLAAADPALSSAINGGIPGHNHVVATRNDGKPEWWPVEVVGVTDPAVFNSLTSVSAINAAVAANKAVTAPTNVFLFFQVLPGTVPTATYNAAYDAAFPTSSPSATYPNLKQTCGAGGPYCENIGVTSDWYNGSDVQALYTESYYCGTPADGKGAQSASGCEAGAASGTNPPAVTGTVPTAANSYPTPANPNIDPLYIPVPLGFTPSYEQCPAASPCIDHPTSIDLSRLASVLDPVLGTTPAQLANTKLPGHDHLLTTLNTDNPEWWNVVVVPVTSQAALDQIQSLKDYSKVRPLETGNFSSGIGPELDTNTFLWFQTLPGTAAATPGPVQTTCMSHLPSGSVVGMAASPSGNGYVEVDAAGDVAAMGGASCYGSLTGIHLQKPIVGITTDAATGGYWLVASDGGVFSFNAPFYGSAGAVHLAQPIVGIAATTNGEGYRLVASDGGVFDYGNAAFYGSTGGVRLTKPVVGIGSDPSSGGYWLVASDGGVFSFNAPFLGSAGGVRLAKPVVGILPTLQGDGYQLVASDGGIFTYGEASFDGSAGGVALAKPVVGGAPSTPTGGYWEVASDGGVFSYAAPFYGSAA